MVRLTYAEWGRSEYWEMTRGLIGDQVAGDSISVLEDKFASLYEPCRVLLVNRGRYALEIALRTFSEFCPERRDVLYPAYICGSVIATIERCGLRPRPIDVRSDLNIDQTLVEKVISDQTLAVIAVHMYACPADIGNLEEICRGRGVFLVDDAAQVVGIRESERLLGTYGDAGILSFSQSKTLVAGGINAGGALLVNNPALINRMERFWKALPPGCYTLSDRWQFLRDSLWEPYLGVPYYYWTKLRRRWSSSGTSGLSCSATRIAPTTAAVALRQLNRLDQRIAGRRSVAMLFQKELLALPGVGFPQYCPGRYLTRILLMMPMKTNMPALRSALRCLGIQTRPAYQMVETAGATFPNALLASTYGLELPSHSRMDRGMVKRIVDGLSQSLREGNTVVSLGGA